MATNNGTRPEIVVSYKECQRNHAAKIMHYAIDGCGEFEPSGQDGTPESFYCAACSCHRSFHKKVQEELPTNHALTASRSIPPPEHHPSLRRSARLAFVNQSSIEVQPKSQTKGQIKEETGKKRIRTKFTPAQKDQMKVFANKLGWTLRGNAKEIVQFCSEIGITRRVFRVWINNNKRQQKAEKITVQETQFTE